ncbi:nucleotidyltransferase domain-containing protein [Candidatus Woesearchaeota archaeon]|nr:nucleotidyltransferase domain-containing protein [Candidatus Woesearchaeota archaeon]
MKFEVKKGDRKKKYFFPEKDFEIAKRFAESTYKEFGGLIKAIILFGSTVRNVGTENRDIDILIVLDDVGIILTKEIIQTYRVIIEKIMWNIEPNKLHVQSMRLTSFWDYVRAGDPVAINILRYGYALVDTGFFDPLQALLDRGRIRPSQESIYTYYTMAPVSLQRSKEHMLNATMDLYWACIDSAHAALMAEGEIPPSPDHVADMIDKDLVSKNLTTKKYSETMRLMYKTFKQIVHRELSNVSGSEYERYKKQASEFVNEMKKIIERKR